MMIIDAILINLSYILAYCFRFNFDIPNKELLKFLNNAIIITIIYLVIYSIFKLYKSLWSYASTDEFLLGIVSCIIASLVTLAYTTMISNRIPYSISILSGIFLLSSLNSLTP